VDALLKALLVQARTVDHILGKRAVESAVKESLSPSKVQILRLLGQRGVQTSSQIARFLGVTKPAVSQIVDTMVRDRLMVRRPAKSDRREVRLELTKKGMTAFQAVQRQQRHFLRSATRRLSKAQTSRWTELLQEMSTHLAKADSDFKEFCLQCGAHRDGTCVLSGGDAECPFLRHITPLSKA
jgi:DNA-binding MarR family transcriptional regulator